MFSCNIYYARGTGAHFSIRGAHVVVIYIMREGRVHSFSIKREGLMFSCNIYYARGTVHSFSIKREGLMFSCNIYYARGTGAQF